jgi:hypothetical protein
VQFDAENETFEKTLQSTAMCRIAAKVDGKKLMEKIEGFLEATCTENVEKSQFA